MQSSLKSQMRCESQISCKPINIEIEKLKFAKTSTSINKLCLLIINIEKKTIVFDFDETLAKVD